MLAGLCLSGTPVLGVGQTLGLIPGMQNEITKVGFTQVPCLFWVMLKTLTTLSLVIVTWKPKGPHSVKQHKIPGAWPAGQTLPV